MYKRGECKRKGGHMLKLPVQFQSTYTDCKLFKMEALVTVGWGSSFSFPLKAALVCCFPLHLKTCSCKILLSKNSSHSGRRVISAKTPNNCTISTKKGSEMGHMTDLRCFVFVLFCFFSQIVPQTRAPGCHSRADVTTLSTGRRTASKATPSREPELCAGDLVLNFLCLSFWRHIEVFALVFRW